MRISSCKYQRAKTHFGPVPGPYDWVEKLRVRCLETDRNPFFIGEIHPKQHTNAKKNVLFNALEGHFWKFPKNFKFEKVKKKFDENQQGNQSNVKFKSQFS